MSSSVGGVSTAAASSGGGATAGSSGAGYNPSSNSPAIVGQLGSTLWTKQPKVNSEFFALTYGSLINELLRDVESSDKINAELDRMGYSVGIRCVEEFLAKLDTAILSSNAASSSSSSTGSGAGGSQGGSGGQSGGGCSSSGGAPSSSSAVAVSSTATSIAKCRTFPETADVVRIAFRMFLGIDVTTVASPSAAAAADKDDGGGDNKKDEGATTSSSFLSSYSVVVSENPLTIFVELPEERSDMEYSQVLCGMIRGMLEMLQYDVTCSVTRSPLSVSTSSDGDVGGSADNAPSSDSGAGDGVTEIKVSLNQVLQEGAGDDYHEE